MVARRDGEHRVSGGAVGRRAYAGGAGDGAGIDRAVVQRVQPDTAAFGRVVLDDAELGAAGGDDQCTDGNGSRGSARFAAVATGVRCAGGDGGRSEKHGVLEAVRGPEKVRGAAAGVMARGRRDDLPGAAEKRVAGACDSGGG